MSQIKRIVFAAKSTVAIAIGGIMHYRVGTELYAVANTYPGPFSGAIDQLEFIVPISLGIMLLAVWIWVLIAPVQEERKKQVLPP